MNKIHRFWMVLKSNVILQVGLQFTSPGNIFKQFGERKEQTNKMHKINFGLINLLFFNDSNMFRPLNRSHHQGVQNPLELQAIVVIC